jgi:hypothetical protein
MSKYIEHEAAYEAAISRNIIGNARKTFMKRERALDVVNWLHTARGNFAASLLQSLENYGKLTDKQFAAVIRCIEGDAVRKAEWEARRQEAAAKSLYVGEVGKRINIHNVKVEAVITMAATRFSYYDRDEQEVYLLRDTDGNRLVWRSKKYDVGIAKGDVVNLVATVKAHQEFRGELQTMLSRPRFEMVTPAEAPEQTTAQEAA